MISMNPCQNFGRRWLNDSFRLPPCRDSLVVISRTEYQQRTELDMDWTTPLRSLQADFIHRLKSEHLLHSKTEGQHSELTIVSGERLRQLRDFCWEMAEKYKRNSPVRKVFIDNMKGKLGEEVVKARLENFVTEVDYETRLGGDGKIDFTLTSDSDVGIQVKARQGRDDTVQWWISQEEVEKNAALVCILIQEEVNEAQAEYHLILAGFLPTNMIQVSNGKASFGIDELLYGGGLRSYLENLESLESEGLFLPLPKIQQQSEQTPDTPISDDAISKAYAYLSLGIDRHIEKNYSRAIEDFNEAIRLNSQLTMAYKWRGNSRSDLGDYQGSIEDYNQALQLIPEDAAILYNNRGIDRYEIGDKQGAIEDFNRAISINPNYANAYFARGVVRYYIGDKQGAIEDYDRAISINPNDADAYYNRGVARSGIGDDQRAIEDYDRAISINPNNANAYYNRGIVRSDIGDKQGALKDFQKAANLYQEQGNQEYYQYALDEIRKLQQ